MAEVLTLNAEPRKETGSKASRRLRREGIVPGNVYGHKQDPQPIQLKADDVRHVLHKGGRVVDLAVGGGAEKALLSEIQWDTFSQHLLHVDFLRVDPDEKVEVKVPVHLRGNAPGVLAGGILEQTHHELTVECLAVDIPTEILVRIGALQMGETVHVSDLTELPTGVKIVDAPDTIVLHIVEPRAPEEEAAPAGEGAEPEVIGRKKEEGEGEA
jgi:large subunit ribosomal protein L25